MGGDEEVVANIVYEVIHKDYFEHVCPDYGGNLDIALEDLSEDKIDSNDNTICMTVHAYDTKF